MTENEDFPALYEWRMESRQDLNTLRRERIRSAMLAEAARAGTAARPLSLRFRWRRLVPVVLTAAAGALVASVVSVHPAPVPTVAEALAATHLHNAERALAAAGKGTDTASNLKKAQAELGVAREKLTAQPASSLWTQWDQDEQELQHEETRYGVDSSPTETASATPEPSQSDSERESPSATTSYPAWSPTWSQSEWPSSSDGETGDH